MLQGTTVPTTDKYPRAKSRCIYWCFVDLEKAFDSVNRVALWHSMHKKPKLWHRIGMKRRYMATKFCVKWKRNEVTEPISQEEAVGRQGCSFSPHLFDTFIDDTLDCFKKETDTP